MITTAHAISLRNVRLRTLVALLAGLAPAFGQDTPTARWEGRPISRIEFDPPQQPLPLEELNRLLAFKVGSSLRMDDVRGAIQKLYSTGRFGDVLVDASQDGPNVALRISTELNYFISGVNIAGESEPPNRNQLITSSKLELGSLFVESDLDRAIDNMQEKLRANGLYNAIDSTPRGPAAGNGRGKRVFRSRYRVPGPLRWHRAGGAVQ